MEMTNGSDKAVVLIPARLQSTRFPAKPLARILGREMVLRVCDVAQKAVGEDGVYVATDSPDIEAVVKQAGYRCIMTSEQCLTGTDRIAEAATHIHADIIINVQGDEPMVDPADIMRILEEKRAHPSCVINGMHPITADEDPHSVNIPKVVFNEQNALLYMSRAAIPGCKTPTAAPYWKQVCIYAFSKDELQQYAGFGRKSHLEAREDIEILRFLDLSIPVRMVATQGTSLAVDVPEDIAKVEQALGRSNL
jgi:3-deoxy-manno-octulosonate cytidylyltransferase (CMP-KDO synthetase)